MPGDQATGVLHTEVALQGTFQQIPRLRKDTERHRQDNDT